MKEYPILFTGAMVRAILEGRKTQTRRIVSAKIADHLNVDWLFSPNDPTILNLVNRFPGDRLWGKETFAPHPDSREDSYVYRATDPEWSKTPGWRWKPSLFMPRAASRLLLNITHVKIERLADISEADAIAEGVESFRPVPGDGPAMTFYKAYHSSGIEPYALSDPRLSYLSLWHKIHGTEWGKINPWVVAYSFEMLNPADLDEF